MHKMEAVPVVGFVNVGNSCYLSAVAHALRHTYPIARLFGSAEAVADLPDTPAAALTKQWASLQQSIRAAGGRPNCSVSPVHFVRVVRSAAAKLKTAEAFGDGNQHDVADFLQFVLDQFHAATSVTVRMSTEGVAKNREDEMMLASYREYRRHFASDYSAVVEMFSGQFYQRVQTCDDEQPVERSESYDPFTVLQLPIPTFRRGKCRLTDCLDLFVASETIEAWRARDGAPARLAQKTVWLWSLPKVLVIQIKRFSGYRVKDQREISFEPRLDLSMYCHGYDRNSAEYELYAVLNHSGSALHGHYTADCRDSRTGVWRRYDDSAVQTLTEDQFSQRDAYVLFYHRRPPTRQPPKYGA